MAQDIQITTTCDPCDLHEIRGVTAVATHVLAIDGGPPKALDVCSRDEVLFQEFLRLYRESGREVETAQTAKPVKKRKPKAVNAPQRKELEEAPASQPDGQEPAAQEEPAKEKQFLLCPLPHVSVQGAPLTVNYRSRSTHASMVHNLHVWEIKWEDPDHILKAFCVEHPFCNNIGFTSTQGLKQHSVAMRSKDVPATGPEDGESDGQTEVP